MPMKADLPKIEDVKNYPKDSRAEMILVRGGHIRVIKREYYWNKEKKRGCENRTYLGYVVENCFLSNEEYAAQYTRRGRKRLIPVHETRISDAVEMAKFVGALETKLAAELPLYYTIAEETGLVEDLTTVWGEERARATLSVAFHWLHTGSNSAYLYNSWAENKLLPYKSGLSSKEMSQFFASLVSVPGWRKMFFNARVKRLPDKEMLSFDATEVGSDAAEISYAQYGAGKDGGYQRQIGLILLVGHESHMPVLFRIVPGNITDMTTVPDMLFRFDEITGGQQVFAAVVDRGYFSLENIARFIDTGSRVIVAAKNDSNWIKEAIEEAMPHLWMNEARIASTQCWGWTVACEPKFKDSHTRKVWVHVYRSDTKTHIETEAFYRDLEAFEKNWMNWKATDKRLTCPLLKSHWMKFFKTNGAVPGKTPLVQNNRAIDEATRYFGIFCNVTTMQCTAKESMVTYRARDLIEKTFKGGKSNFEMDVVRAHNENTLEGRFIIGFVAMTILSRLYVRMKTKLVTETKTGPKEIPALADEMTFNELKNRLATPRIVYDSAGNIHWMEVTRRQHRLAARLGLPDLYKNVPLWGK